MSTHQANQTLLGEISDLMKREHYSVNTERTYCDWIKQFVKFHCLQTRESLFVEAENKVEKFLTYLATEREVSASTQNQAFNALVFLYKRVLEMPLENVRATRSRKEARIPVVLTREEVKQVLPLLDGVPELVVKLLYGSGLRITEAVRLRVQDLDFGFKQVTVRNGKGMKDRATPFPEILAGPLHNHLEKMKMIHEKDLMQFCRLGKVQPAQRFGVMEPRFGVCWARLLPLPNLRSTELRNTHDFIWNLDTGSSPV